MTAFFGSYCDKLRQSAERRLGLNQPNKIVDVGKKAPDFTLYNTDNKEVSLYDLLEKSNVILLFFPLAFTSVCTEELCSVRDNMNKYVRLNATVLGISVDSMFALNKFKQEKHYQFDLLSDFNKDVAKKYGALHEQFPLFGMKGVTKRAAFVINQRGIIRYMEVLDNPGDVPNFNSIENVLREMS